MSTQPPRSTDKVAKNKRQQPKQCQCTSLQEAIDLFTANRKGMTRKESHDGTTIETTYPNNNTTSGQSVDLLAVVVRLSTVIKTHNRSAEVWIIDASIEEKANSNIHIVVSLFGNGVVTAIQEQQLCVGSVVRFHGVTLRRMMEQRTAAGNKSTTFEFQCPWDIPREVEWLEVDRVVTTTATDGANPQQRQQQAGTDKRQVQDLIHWYRQSKYYKNQLSPVPCQKRSLEEVSASRGVVSNVMVHVTNLETLSDRPSNHHLAYKRRKRQSSSPSKVSIVTVSDGRHNLMPLVLANDAHYRFQKTLQKALQEGQPVMLNHVVCRKGREVPAWVERKQQQREENDEEVVLVPTTTTNMVLLPKETSDDCIRPTPTEQTQTFLTSTQPFERTQASRTSSSMSSNQTQAYLTAPTQASKQLKRKVLAQDHSTAQIIKAPLVAICIEELGVRLGGGQPRKHQRPLPDPAKLLAILTTKNSCTGKLSYREATLLIVPPPKPFSKSDHEKLVRVHANGAALENLCGGFDANELKENPELMTRVSEWLQALLEDQFPLLWWFLPVTKEKDFDYELNKVTLANKDEASCILSVSQSILGSGSIPSHFFD